MKKIVGIIAAVAMAASVFAADISSAVKLQGKVANYDGDAFTMLNAINPQSETYAAPTFALSIDNGKAGGQLKIVKTKAAIEGADYAVWFKPVDMVKVTLGTLGAYNLNTETMDYTNVMGGAGWGYAAELNTNGLLIAVSTTGELLTKDNAVPQLYTKVAYSADFGTIGFVFDSKTTFDAFRLGAGYSGNVGSTSFFADVYYYNQSVDAWNVNSWEVKYNGKPVVVDGFVKTNIDNIGLMAYAKASIPTEDGVDVAVAGKIKATYGLSNGMTASLKIADDNFLADTFAMTITPGIEGNLAGMSWNVKANLNIGDKFTMDVPFEVSVNF